MVLGALSLLSFAAPFAWARGPEILHSLHAYATTAFSATSDASPDLVATGLPSRPAPSVIARSVPVCSGGDRAKRKVTCLVDGDTGWHDGMKWRTAGIDTPEIDHAACPRERQIGTRARDRLRQLMSAGYALDRQGSDNHGRALVTITLGDGRDAGQVLIDEGLSQAWPNSGNPWCDQDRRAG
ncbi:hypothetical protein GCM10011335_14620 [Aureimonas glaciei]|uniref:TNase-like domain-containing protein n=1 Tax=Aureimonas glaciei TaxID=1776957 RepID=A0A916XUE5_9HYPH|nr:hypothetical protein GCM10011335_14620 [Aureimonas glaciei]